MPAQKIIIVLAAVAFCHLSAGVVAGAETATPQTEKSQPSFLTPVGDFVRDDILRPIQPFQLVPGKDANDWTFVLEPYVWAMGLSGDVGVKGLPPAHVEASDRAIIQHLDWGIFVRGEVRKGRWGVLADGYYAALSGSTGFDDSIYQSASLGLQQSIVSLALSYRVIDDRRGFLDLYGGVRYNYLGLQFDASLNSDVIGRVGQNTSERISERIASATGRAVDAAAGALVARLSPEIAAVRKAGSQRLAALQREIQQAIRQGAQADIEKLQLKQQQVANEVANTITAGVVKVDGLQGELKRQVGETVTRDVIKRRVVLPTDLRKFEDRRDLKRLLNPVRREIAEVVAARVQQQLGVARASAGRQFNTELVGFAEQRVNSAQRVLENAIASGSERAQSAARRLVAASEAQLAAAQSRLASAKAADTAALDREVTRAEKKLATAISDDLEDSLPTDVSGAEWWFDPIIGARAQVNLTHWLFLALQGDVGGFGAGSQIAWNTQATVGFNFTRNVFAELGYRYMYVDYTNDGFLYQMNSYGIFSSIGFKF